MTREDGQSLSDMVVGTFEQVDFKMAGCLFLLFVILSSDVFINRILSRFQGAVDYQMPTNWGVILQSSFLVLAYVILIIGQNCE